MNTLNISSIFTPTGLTQALKAHHKNLSDNHNFPPLSGAKPLHRFAELFELKNAEHLEDRLKKLTGPQVGTLETTLNLVNQKAQAQVQCFFEEEDGTLRVQCVDEPTLLMVTLDEAPTISPKVHYLSHECALITYDNVQVHIFLSDNTLTAELYEPSKPEIELSPYHCDINNLIDSQSTNELAIFVPGENMPSQKTANSNAPITVYNVIKKEQDRVYVHSEVSYLDAMNAVREDIREACGNLSTDQEILEELGVEMTEFVMENIDDVFDDKINEMDENEANKIYTFLHESDSYIRIETSIIRLSNITPFADFETRRSFSSEIKGVVKTNTDNYNDTDVEKLELIMRLTNSINEKCDSTLTLNDVSRLFDDNATAMDITHQLSKIIGNKDSRIKASDIKLALMEKPINESIDKKVRKMLIQELANEVNAQHYTAITTEQIAEWLTPESSLKEIAFFLQMVLKKFRTAITPKTILANKKIEKIDPNDNDALRKHLIIQLTTEINTKCSSALTYAQVDDAIGIGVQNSTIKDKIKQVSQGYGDAMTAKNVLDYEVNCKAIKLSQEMSNRQHEDVSEDNRSQLIFELTTAINLKYQSELTIEQVNNWLIEDDAFSKDIKEYIDELGDDTKDSLNPIDIMSLWN
jgi:hypothetical protein